MIEVKTQRPIIYQGDLSELESFIADDGHEYFYSADGEHFYNAKGEKVAGFFKKVGGGIVKGGKGIAKGAAAVGRAIKKAAVAVAKASKTVVAGVKKVGGKAKKGSKKLIHHKRKTPAGLNAGAGLAGLGLSPKQAALLGKGGKLSLPQAKPTATAGSDVFSLPLKKLTPIETQSMKPEEIVTVNGQSYSTQGIEPGKDVVVVNDEETGQEMVTVQYEPDEVVGVTGQDGNIEYVKKDDVQGMSKALKYTLIIGGSVIVLTILGYVIYKASKKK